MVVLYKAWRILWVFWSGALDGFEICFLPQLTDQLVAKKRVQAAVNTNVGWNEPPVAPLQQMKPGEFAHAGIKSLNIYNPKSLENKPECPGGVLAVLWNDVRRTEFIRDFSKWEILGFILIYVKYAKWESTAHYLHLAGISPWCCGRESFLNQSLRLCISFCLSPQLSLCCQTVSTLALCPHFSEWQILPLSIISH